MMEATRIFVERPELRPFFFDDVDLPAAGETRDRVLAVAELYLDLAEGVASAKRHGQLTGGDYEAWRREFHDYFERSPAVRQLWTGNRATYLPETADLFPVSSGSGPPTPQE
jgi:hypothetical protein